MQLFSDDVITSSVPTSKVWNKNKFVKVCFTNSSTTLSILVCAGCSWKHIWFGQFWPPQWCSDFHVINQVWNIATGSFFCGKESIFSIHRNCVHLRYTCTSINHPAPLVEPRRWMRSDSQDGSWFHLSPQSLFTFFTRTWWRRKLCKVYLKEYTKSH